eukprot:scaffold1811_cov411-Prasinococcus_capsulatus_cf.AAC.22
MARKKRRKAPPICLFVSREYIRLVDIACTSLTHSVAWFCASQHPQCPTSCSSFSKVMDTPRGKRLASSST